ncbi:MAG: ribosome biogenesis GTPase Der [Chloroherpetonaceae bacterium]|nr:ribosome biogenesis GTPase Der [Chloroherpetonaceae bacterium]MDW8436530.1 ribosome biogenesis GTPase Der [Chloroherpetonaceae bacterium]
MKPIVAIVGRPNVGKSTLFNRIVGKRHAIVDDIPGVTRDRNYLDAEWNGKLFALIDTGGYTTAEDQISKAVLEQVFLSIDEADAIIFVVDVKSGVTDLDAVVAEHLRKELDRKKIFFAINKVETEKDRLDAEAFRRLGLGEPYPISALNGNGVAELLDSLVAALPCATPTDADDANAVKLAVVGRPNVGKSSFVNAVLGQNRQIVTDIAGTTRDAIDSEFRRNGQRFILIDTAGLRRRARVENDIEFFSAARTERAMERADVVIAMIDATQGLEKQDLRIINDAVEKKRGVVIAVNKWDVIEKDAKTADDFASAMRERLGSLSYIPIVFVSALTKQRVFKAIDMAKEVWETRRKRIATSDLNDALLPEIRRNAPWTKSGKEVKIKYVAQLSTEPPLIAFFGSNAKQIEEPYKRFLERKIREHFGFEGTPIELQFRLK